MDLVTIGALQRMRQILFSYRNTVTALAGGGQTGAYAIERMLTQFTTVATTGDSAILPPSVPGIHAMTVVNAGANAMNIYPNVGGQIAALGVNAAMSLAAGKTVSFYCTAKNQWYYNLSA